MTPQEHLVFARRFIGAIQNGDVEVVRTCYAADAKIWHNNDGVEQSVDENMRVLGWFMRNLPDRKYRITRLEALPDGYVQQHVLEATLPNGEKWALDACVVVRMDGDKIVRLDEYLDSAKVGVLMKAHGR
jgi:ketosteroid isomerase-like protein